MCVQEGRGLLEILLILPSSPGGLRVVLEQELNLYRRFPSAHLCQGKPLLAPTCYPGKCLQLANLWAWPSAVLLHIQTEQGVVRPKPRPQQDRNKLTWQNDKTNFLDPNFYGTLLRTFAKLQKFPLPIFKCLFYTPCVLLVLLFTLAPKSIGLFGLGILVGRRK